MDFLLPNFNTVVTVIFALLLFVYYQVKKFKPATKLSPQPMGAWPIIGHLPLLSGSHLPHLTLATLADKYGPIFTLRIGIHSVLVVSSSEVTKELFSANDLNVTFRPLLVSAKLMGYNYAFFPFTPGGPYWRETRKISNLHLLSNRRLELLKHIRTQEVETSIKELYQSWKDNTKIIEMKEWFSDLSMNSLLRMIIGKKFFGAGATGDQTEGRRFQNGITVLFHYLGTLVLRDAVPFLGWMDVGGHEKRMKRTAKELDDSLEKWLEEHKQKINLGDIENDKNFMDSMISVLDGKNIEGYDANTINKATCLQFGDATMLLNQVKLQSMIAGNETVTVAITWALSLLLTNKHALKKAQEELDKYVGKERLVNDADISKLVYLQAIVKETLRLYPPAIIPGPRQFTKDCTIGGYHVAKGTWLMMNLWKIHRDPNVWPEPADFKPERFLTTHKDIDVRGNNFELLPFGGGRRACPAVSFGLQMMHLTLASLLHAFEISTPNNALLDMSPGIGLTNKKTTPLEVLISPRLPSYCFE
ncbi:cytochrome P450, putative [Ricinus communis]|uniref:Cytochrome P450, putative n=1 Tax=Ricinus communis TaxID=3988 RepID=B9R7L2_RICCO|nr:cytochrome P450, putative [Ricinus communis]